MKITKLKKSTYPRKITFDNGRSSKIPNQKKFKSEYIRHHGCSLAAFYVALGFCGKTMKINPLLKWSRKNLKKYMRAKLTIKGVAVGINKRTGSKRATYHKKATYNQILNALKRGHLVLLELGNPIHTVTLYRSDGKNYRIDHGQIKKTKLKELVKKATKSSTYRGWVDVRG